MLKTFLFSLRARLIFLVILTATALLFQLTFVTSSQGMIDEIEDLGAEYLVNDTAILEDFIDLENILVELRGEQVGSIITELLFNKDLDTNKGVDTVQRFNSKLLNLSLKIEERNILGYSLDAVNRTNQIVNQFSQINSELNDFTDINFINTTENGVQGLLNSTKVEVDDAFLIFEDITAEVFPDIPAENYTQEGIERVFKRINRTIGDFVNDLNDERRQLNSHFTSQLENDVNETGVLPTIGAYVDNILNRLEHNESVSTIDDDIVDVVILNSLTLYREIANLVLYLERIQSERAIESELSPEELQVEFLAANDSIAISNQLIRSAWDNARNNATDPATDADLFNLFIFYRNIHARISEVLAPIFLEIPQFIFIYNTGIEKMRNLLLSEQASFSSEFNTLITNLRTNLINNIQTLSFLLIAILTSITAVTVIQFFISFNRMGRNYKLVGDGNLKIKTVQKQKSSELGVMETGFQSMIEDLRGILTTLQKSSERIAGISEELAAGAEEASASVQEVSNTVREFAAGASEQNIMLSRVSEKLNDHLVEIENTAASIGETSNFVLKVAKRTNILGLNASIEAAKAGNFGRGFNVVAEEVRNLSNDTKTSAIEIADLIQSVETNIQQTVRDILREVDITREVAENTAAGSEEANAATSEQVIMLSEISQTSNELSLLASDLQEIIQRFEL